MRRRGSSGRSAGPGLEGVGGGPAVRPCRTAPVGNNGAVAGSVGSSAGKRAGSRRGPRRRARPSPQLLLLTGGITALVVAWGYLVWAAIDFGAAARGGEQVAWAFLALASLGAVACLFAGLMLGVRLLRLLGVLSPQALGEPTDPGRPLAPKGGKRAAR